MGGPEAKKLSAVHAGMAAAHADSALNKYTEKHAAYDADDKVFVQGLDNLVGLAESYLEELERCSGIDADAIYADDDFIADQTVVEHLDEIEYHVQTAKQHYNTSIHHNNEVEPEEAALLDDLREELGRLNKDVERMSYTKV